MRVIKVLVNTGRSDGPSLTYMPRTWGVPSDGLRRDGLSILKT